MLLKNKSSYYSSNHIINIKLILQSLKHIIFLNKIVIKNNN